MILLRIIAALRLFLPPRAGNIRIWPFGQCQQAGIGGEADGLSAWYRRKRLLEIR